MKQSNNDLSNTFFNSVEEMNEYYGISAEVPSKLYSNADLVCYEIGDPFVYDGIGQYVFSRNGFHHLNQHGKPDNNHNEITSELEVYEYDPNGYEGGCFVYVRVNEYLRKHLEKTLIGCEFVHYTDKTEIPFRRFVHGVEVRKSGIIVLNQDGLVCHLNNQLFYPDDYSDPIHYKEWVKKINEQDVEG